MDSQIQNFFRNKVIFLTGGTGFLGKVFIEKLIRTTDVQQIYVLTRPKAGIDITERFRQIFKDPLFEKLHTIRPQPMKYIHPIAGDCTLPNLGISDDDRKMLIENVHVVIHGAATVRFNQPLSNTVQINIQATLDVINLAKEMKQLKSFVHVSSAFANCLIFHCEEKFYNDSLEYTSDQLLCLKNTLGDEKLDRLEGQLIGKYPNNYCFTKSIAEEAVLKHGSTLPLCVFRPGIILPTYDEPAPGWIDNLYGPMSVLYGCTYGVLRVMLGNANTDAGLVPVDFCANMMLACAWHTATTVKQIPSKEPTIYNLVPDDSNTLQWGAYKRYVETYGIEYPLTKMIWYPFLIFTNNIFAYRLLTFFYHTLPGYIIDFMLLLMGKKTRMTKTYKKIHSQCSKLRYFLDHNFTFEATNTRNLWQLLSPNDRRIYNFDMVSLKWDTYFFNSLIGLRRYSAKEDPSTIPQAKRLMKRFYVLHCAVHILAFAALVWLLWPLLKLIFFS